MLRLCESRFVAVRGHSSARCAIGLGRHENGGFDFCRGRGTPTPSRLASAMRALTVRLCILAVSLGTTGADAVEERECCVVVITVLQFIVLSMREQAGIEVLLHSE